MSQARGQYLQDLANNIAALLTGHASATPIQRSPGHGEDGIRRRAAENVTYRVDHPGLVRQLVDNLPPSSGQPGDDSGGGRTKPGSRPPVNSGIATALDQIESEAAWLQRDMRHAAGRPPRRCTTVTGNLEDVRGVAHLLDDTGARTAAVLTARWVSLARAALALDAPVATLRDVPCPHCQHRLKVRSDASSDVWCPNPACRDTEGRRHRWARAEWPFLLERIAGGPRPEQGQEGAA